MPDTSSRLELPFIMPSQAQKHVTHNAAIQTLDMIVQMSAEEVGTNTPPTFPQEGLLYGLGSSPTGDWAAHPHAIAQFSNGAWAFVEPQDGWLVWNKSSGAFHVKTTSGWDIYTPNLQNIDGIGIGTTSDATNRIAVAADASLFSHNGAGHQLKLNKATTTDTASVLLQSGWVGHAEFGLAGDNRMSIKASADGTDWFEAISIDPSAKTLSLAVGDSVGGQLTETAFQIDRQITGTAVQSSVTDTTSGRLLRNGAFGIGVQLPSNIDDIDSDTTPNGWWRTVDGTLGTFPSGASKWGVLQTVCFNTGILMQTYTTTGHTAGYNRIWHRWRDKNSNTWRSWYEAVTTYNAVGTINDTSASILETGTNSNGRYVRHKDGTQICWASVTTSDTSVQSWIYPASFVGTPQIHCTPASAAPTNGISPMVDAATTTSTTGGVLAFNSGNTQVATSLQVMAIGTWI